MTEAFVLNLKKLTKRVGDTGDFIKLDEEKCNGCGKCALICSMGLWRVPLGKKAKLSPKYKELCLECAACWEICEQEAIDFWYPKGGTGIIIEYG